MTDTIITVVKKLLSIASMPLGFCWDKFCALEAKQKFACSVIVPLALGYAFSLWYLGRAVASDRDSLLAAVIGSAAGLLLWRLSQWSSAPESIRQIIRQAAVRIHLMEQRFAEVASSIFARRLLTKESHEPSACRELIIINSKRQSSEGETNVNTSQTGCASPNCDIVNSTPGNEGVSEKNITSPASSSTPKRVWLPFLALVLVLFKIALFDEITNRFIFLTCMLMCFELSSKWSQCKDSFESFCFLPTKAGITFVWLIVIPTLCAALFWGIKPAIGYVASGPLQVLDWGRSIILILA